MRSNGDSVFIHSALPRPSSEIERSKSQATRTRAQLYQASLADKGLVVRYEALDI